MSVPDTNTETAEQHSAAARETARREVFRLARERGAEIVTRPMFWGDKEPSVRDVEPLTGARAARDLEAAAEGTARDYIRQAREAGHGWDEIGQVLGLASCSANQADAMAGDAAYTYAAGRPDTEAPWRPRSFLWTCRSCEQVISDRGLCNGPVDDEHGHADDCPRLEAAVAAWQAEWEPEP